VLDSARTGDEAEPGLRLAEDRRFARGKTHVARQHELAAGAAHPALDLCDGHEPAGAQVPEHEAERGLAGQLRRRVAVLRDARHVDVGYEVVGVGAPEDQDLNRLVALGLLDERNQVADQRGAQEVHRRGGYLREEDGPFRLHFQRLEVHLRPPFLSREQMVNQTPGMPPLAE
jgi:hypothetical protein